MFLLVNVNTSTRCILFFLQYLKLNNLLYHDILNSNLLSNIDINEETQIKVVKNNVSVEEVDSVICSISNITFVCEM